MDHSESKRIPDMVLQARLINAAYCERNGIPCEHPFKPEELRDAHDQLDDAERAMDSQSVRISNHDMTEDQRLDDPRHGQP